MQLDNVPVRDSIQRIPRPATEGLAPKWNIWRLYGALDAAQRQMTGAAEGGPDPRAYAQLLRRYMQETHRQPQRGVITPGQLSKTASWMELTEARQAQEAADAPWQPRMRSTWTGHPGEATTNTPWHTRYTTEPYQRRRKTRNKLKPDHLDRHPNNGHCTASWQNTPSSRTQTSHTWSELQDWPKYETEVLEGHTGAPATTPPIAWDHLMPEGDIGALSRQFNPRRQDTPSTTATNPL